MSLIYCFRQMRCFSTRRRVIPKEISILAEVVQREKLLDQLQTGSIAYMAPDSMIKNYLNCGFSEIKTKLMIDAVLSTFLLHVEARIASSKGKGFYTIGPCGEETMAAAGMCLMDTDFSALHYRHVATEVMRQLNSGVPLEQIMLDRARGYTCSSLDPVTGGKHCAIGGHEFSYLVTSTLSSQAPPAVGRALGIPLLKRMGVDTKINPKSVSFVTVGDGSVNNAHFLSALNMAEYARHVKRKCPVVFGISDNELCISLKGRKWVDHFVAASSLKSFTADARDIGDVFLKTEEAFRYSRDLSRPSLILYKNIRRRFGHAATDRQSAYLSPNEIQEAAETDNLMPFLATAVQSGHVTVPYLADRMSAMIDMIEKSFDIASMEPKINNRVSLIMSNSQPLDTSNDKSPTDKALHIENLLQHAATSNKLTGKKATGSSDVMRKHMTRCFDEALEKNRHMMYIGEDVEHGGYYLVTDGLLSKYPGRVVDFPPDETSLVGAAIGFSQLGLLTVLEIPYAKYLDCASDMFNEAAILNWLSNGRQPNGMVVRLQGFGKGIFGGNFHTHNMLQIPPGLDVVCFSNGRDYVRGMRYALRQAKAGRMVMSVDCTDLLNRRHFDPNTIKDSLYLTDYPEDKNDERSFDEVTIYEHKSIIKSNAPRVAVVTYGNGVATVTLAVMTMLRDRDVADSLSSVSIIDSPYLTAPPQQLVELLESGIFDRIVFADSCKEGPGMPLAGIAATLQRKGILSVPWQAVGAQYTYNPLGSTLTFLSEQDVMDTIHLVIKKK